MHWFTCNDAERRVGGVKIGGSLLRAGRAFLYLADSSRIQVGWHFFAGFNYLEARVRLDNDEDGLTFTLVVPWLAYLYVSLPLRRRWLSGWMIQDRVWSVKLGYIGHLVDLEFAWAAWAEDCGMTDYYRRQAPRRYTDRQLWPGWRWSVRWPPVLRWLFGREERGDSVLESKPVVVELDGRRYEGTWELHLQRTTRERWPWPYRTSVSSWLEMPQPPRFAGKGESSWDCGDDAIYGMGSRELTAAGAVGEYVKRVLENRERYGQPSEL